MKKILFSPLPILMMLFLLGTACAPKIYICSGVDLEKLATPSGISQLESTAIPLSDLTTTPSSSDIIQAILDFLTEVAKLLISLLGLGDTGTPSSPGFNPDKSITSPGTVSKSLPGL